MMTVASTNKRRRNTTLSQIQTTTEVVVDDVNVKVDESKTTIIVDKEDGGVDDKDGEQEKEQHIIIPDSTTVEAVNIEVVIDKVILVSKGPDGEQKELIIIDPDELQQVLRQLIVPSSSMSWCDNPGHNDYFD